MAEITISDLPSKTALLDSDLVPIDDGTQSYRVTGAQLREFLKVNFLPLGTIVWSQSNLATDNVGRLPLWTGEYIASAATLYPDFYAWVKKHTELCKTKEQYDAALAQFGECPFYVVDEEEGSLRLPKLQHYIKNATAEEGITQREEGLPDHTHSINVRQLTGGDTNEVNGWRGLVASQTGPASESNPIYGRSEHVTPAHTTLYPWVYAYNAAIAASVAQTAEFQQGLSGKADTNLSNLTNDGKALIPSLSRVGTRTQSMTIAASGTTYTAPADGYICITMNTTANLSHIIMSQNELKVQKIWPANGLTNVYFWAPVRKGEFSLIYASLTFVAFTFHYAQGAE